METLQMDKAALRYWIAAVSEAAVPFERRWTWAALKRVNPEVHHRLRRQCELFAYSLENGSLADVTAHGADGHLEPTGQLLPRPVAVGLQQREQPQGAGTGVRHDLDSVAVEDRN